MRTESVAAFVVILLALSSVLYFSFDKKSVPVGDPEGDTRVYQNSEFSFSMLIPEGLVPADRDSAAYLPMTRTPVTGFAVSPDQYAGTNLSDAGLYVGATTTESIVSSCTTRLAENAERSGGRATMNESEFSVFTSSDAGAGNFYETKSYRAVHNETCYEIVIVLHSTSISNYDPGTVEAFDRDRFIGLLESTAATFTFTN